MLLQGNFMTYTNGPRSDGLNSTTSMYRTPSRRSTYYIPPVSQPHDMPTQASAPGIGVRFSGHSGGKATLNIREGDGPLNIGTRTA